jgi:hypothetical protein
VRPSFIADRSSEAVSAAVAARAVDGIAPYAATATRRAVTTSAMRRDAWWAGAAG